MKKTLLYGSKCSVEIIERKATRGLEGSHYLYYGLENTTSSRKEFYFNIYPFSITTVGEIYQIAYMKHKDSYRSYILEDEKLIKRELNIFITIYIIASLILSILANVL